MDLRTNTRPMICIFAHPDDEAFGPGGSIAFFAKEQPVYLICVTTMPGKMGILRKEELRKSAALLGVKEVFYLDYPDGGLCNGMYHDVVSDIKKITDRLEPETLLTFELQGISGHVDHVAVSLITTYLFYHTTYTSRLLYFCELEEIITAFKAKDYFVYMPPGYKKSEVSFTINTAEFCDIRKKAMLVHESQRSDAEYILSINEKFPMEEHFIEVKK